MGSAPLLLSPGPSWALPPVKTGLQPPKLVLLLVADQFRADNLARYSSMFVEGGLKRLLRQGPLPSVATASRTRIPAPVMRSSPPAPTAISTASRRTSFGTARAARPSRCSTIPRPRCWAKRAVSTMTLRRATSSAAQSSTKASPDQPGLAGLGRGAQGARRDPAWWPPRTGLLLLGSDGRVHDLDVLRQDLPDWVKAWNKKKLADAGFNKPWSACCPGLVSDGR